MYSDNNLYGVVCYLYGVVCYLSSAKKPIVDDINWAKVPGWVIIDQSDYREAYLMNPDGSGELLLVRGWIGEESASECEV